MTDEELNEAIGTLKSEYEFCVGNLLGTGKVVPYIGWFWRSVSFEHPLRLGIIPGSDGFVGFMERDKWDYESFIATEEQKSTIRGLLVRVAEDPSPKTCQALYDYMQGCRPIEGES